MNEKYYTTGEVQALFGLRTRSIVAKYRVPEKFIKISNRYYYDREHIDLILLKIDTAEYEIAQAVYKTFVESDIDFNEYLSLKGALKIFKRSRQRLYQLKDAGRIKIKHYDGFMWFCKKDLLWNGFPRFVKESCGFVTTALHA